VFVYCDLNNLDSVKGVFQNALDVMGGRVDILVNCAGIQRRSPSVDFLETDWDDVRPRYEPHLSFIFLILVPSSLHILTSGPQRLFPLSTPVLTLLSRFWTSI